MNMLHLWSSPNFLAQLLQDIYEYLDVSNVDGYMPEYSLNSSWFIQNVVGLKRKKKTKCSLQRAVNWLLDLSQLPGQRENKKGLEITGIFFLLLFSVCELEIQRREASYTSCGQQSEHLQSFRGGQRDLLDTCMHILGSDYFLKHFFSLDLLRPSR